MLPPISAALLFVEFPDPFIGHGVVVDCPIFHLSLEIGRLREVGVGKADLEAIEAFDGRINPAVVAGVEFAIEIEVNSVAHLCHRHVVPLPITQPPGPLKPRPSSYPFFSS